MKILIVEDNVALCDSIALQLQQEGIQADKSYDGEEALFLARQQIYDLILLDRLLPSMEGTKVLETLRKERNPVPVILLTALGTLEDKVRGLDLGADDYLVKPFEFPELMARIRSVMRRPDRLAEPEVLCYGDIVYRVQDMILMGPKRSCALSQREGQLLEALLRFPNRSFNREQLFLKVWGIDSDVEQGNLDSYISFLRKRLELVSRKVTIRTLYRVGYRLEQAEE